MPSNWRSRPRPVEKSTEQGRPHNRRPRENGRRRDGGGWVRSSVETGQRPWSKGCAFYLFIRVMEITDILSQNVPLEDVQYLAGHSNPSGRTDL